MCYQIFTIICKSHSEAQTLASHRFCYSWLVEVFCHIGSITPSFLLRIWHFYCTHTGFSITRARLVFWWAAVNSHVPNGKTFSECFHSQEANVWVSFRLKGQVCQISETLAHVLNWFGKNEMIIAMLTGAYQTDAGPGRGWLPPPSWCSYTWTTRWSTWRQAS